MSNSIVIRRNSGNSLTIIKSGSVSTTLAPATNTTLGGIIVGDNLSITSNGVLSAQPGGVTGFNNRTGNVSLTSNDVTTALAYTPLAPLGNVTRANSTAFTGSTESIRGDVHVYISGADTHQQFQGFYSAGAVEPTEYWAGRRVATTANGTQGRTNYFRAAGSSAQVVSSFTNNRTGSVQVSTAAVGTIAFLNASGGDNFANTSFARVIACATTSPSGMITGNSISSRLALTTMSNGVLNLEITSNGSHAQASFYGTGNATTLYDSNSILTQGYADTRYQATGSYLTSSDLTAYLTIAGASSTYSVLGHTHAVSEVTGLQASLDSKLPTANFTYANITGVPSTFTPSAHTHAVSDVTGLQASLDSKLPSANFTYANLTGKPTLATVATSGSYTDLSNLPTSAGLGSNSFTGSQNLQDNELIRAKIRDYSETVSSPTISSGTLALNLETSNIFTVSLNAAITTLTISNPPASGSGGSFTLIFTADGTARAVTWPASIKWAGGTAPTLTSTSGKVDSFAFFSSDGGTSWTGYVGGQNF